jgi:hypothetical protein
VYEHNIVAFYPKNRLKQGANLSPVLFCLYIDELFVELSQSAYDCRMGNKFVRAMGYADDVILLSPTRKGLHNMINICKKYGDDFCISFDKKTVYIKLGKNSSRNNSKLYLDGKEIKQEAETKYLGYCINE